MTKDNETMPDVTRLQMNTGWGSVEEVVCGGTPYIRKDLLSEGIDVEYLREAIEAHKKSHFGWTVVKAAEHLLKLIDMGE